MINMIAILLNVKKRINQWKVYRYNGKGEGVESLVTLIFTEWNCRAQKPNCSVRGMCYVTFTRSHLTYYLWPEAVKYVMYL